MTLRRVAPLVAALLFSACSSARSAASLPVAEAAAGARADAKAPADTSSCDARQTAATAIVEAAIAKARACIQDADCVAVRFGASCFDSCSSPIGAAGRADYETAVAQANEKECAAFFKAGCKLPLPPPCAPQPPPTCQAGACR